MGAVVRRSQAEGPFPGFRMRERCWDKHLSSSPGHHPVVDSVSGESRQEVSDTPKGMNRSDFKEGSVCRSRGGEAKEARRGAEVQL